MLLLEIAEITKKGCEYCCERVRGLLLSTTRITSKVSHLQKIRDVYLFRGLRISSIFFFLVKIRGGITKILLLSWPACDNVDIGTNGGN